MSRYIAFGSLYFLLNTIANLGWSNAIQTIPACKNLKAYPLLPHEKIIDFPKLSSDEEIDSDILEEYFANVAVAYANEAKRQKQQAHEKRKLAIQQIERSSTDKLRRGKKCNLFSIDCKQSFEKTTSGFTHQLKKEAASLEKSSQENLDKGKYFLCVTENVDQILSMKDPINEN